MEVMANILLKTNIKKIIIFIVKILFLIVNRLFFIMKMLTFIMILMLIENYYLKSGNKYFIRYKHPNKTDIVPLQLKLKNFY